MRFHKTAERNRLGFIVFCRLAAGRRTQAGDATDIASLVSGVVGLSVVTLGDVRAVYTAVFTSMYDHVRTRTRSTQILDRGRVYGRAHGYGDGTSTRLVHGRGRIHGRVHSL